MIIASLISISVLKINRYCYKIIAYTLSIISRYHLKCFEKRIKSKKRHKLEKQ